MQTFLPYPNFEASAAVLDNKRLGKQRVEAYQLLKTINGYSDGWSSHPCTKMWINHPKALAAYGLVMCNEWLSRGFSDSLFDKIFLISNLERYPPVDLPMPKWFGSEEFHRSHQSNLLRKDERYYANFFKDVPNNLPYIWPGPG